MHRATSNSQQQRESHADVQRKMLDLQTRRRQQVLQRQRSTRQAQLHKARQATLQQLLFDQQDADQTATPSATPLTPRHASASIAAAYAQQFMQPEWLIEVPTDLATTWYCCARPEGQRCLLIARGGSTVARNRAGFVMARFDSGLPGGSSATAASGAHTVVDAIFQRHASGGHASASAAIDVTDGTFWLLDVLFWNTTDLASCTTEFRCFWLASKAAEEGAAWAASERAGATLAAVTYHTSDANGLAAAYQSPVPYTRDGVLLLHKDALYEGGQVPTALLWKDAHCSRFAIDTDPDGQVPAMQRLVLEYRMDGTVATADDPPCVLGRLPSAAVAALPTLSPGTLLRFSLGTGGVQFAQGQPVGADLVFQGPAGRRRGRADSISKILFQYFARRDPITLTQLGGSAMTD